ncbi:sensor histidine kinase [Pseudactinotalea sp.]|uniref:sensor histidine kinase n=1 Tax=Pseudactinotalea sp. TaxID=1926260 RepID=UPI003B3A6E11
MASIGATLMILLSLSALRADLAGPFWWAILTLVYLLAVLVVGAASITGPLPRLVRAWQLLALGGLALTVVWSVAGPAHLSLTYLLLPAMVAFASVAWRWRNALIFTALGALIPPALGLLPGIEIMPEVVSRAPLQLSTIGFVAIFQGVRHQLTAQWQASSDAVAARAELEGARAALAERARIDSFIHDEILTALLGASREPDEPVVRAHAARALAMLESERVERVPDGGGFVDLRARLVPLVPSGVPFDQPPATQSFDVPATVAEAILGAASEALRNADRHAGGPTRVRLAHTDRGGVLVEVHDLGPGFDSQRIDPARLGVAGSILGRMRALPGGAAEVDSAPGQGTRVVIRWTP